MPKFYQQSEFYVDVDVDEFLSACNARDTEELIDALIEEGYLKEDCRANHKYELQSVPESFYQEALDKLKGKWNMLTQEEEELIIKIANRF